jgi:molybdopterin-guanine dinucleotide biosynthesis protein A
MTAARGPSRSTERSSSIATEPTPSALASIAPIVLVGGRSLRFGRDKLLADVGGRPMVAAPIAALREVFGPRVTLVGDCDPSVRNLAEHWLPDDHPGTGPMGGIATALERLGESTLVLAGDLPAINSATIHRLVDVFRSRPDAAVVLATTTEDGESRDHPCAAVYGQPMRHPFESALRSRRFSLRDAIARLPASSAIRVDVTAAALANINEQADLGRHLASDG